MIKTSIPKFFRAFLSSILITGFFLFAPEAIAQTILIEDHFNDPTLNSWETHVGPEGYLNVVSGELEGSVVKQNNPSDVFTYAVRGDLSWDNYLFVVRIKGVHGVDKKIMFRFQSEETRYDLNLISGSGLYLQRWLNGNPEVLYFSPLQNSNDIWYELKVEANGDNFKIFVNNELKIDYIDPNPLLTGKIGLQIWPGASGFGSEIRTTTRFDDVLVTVIGVEPSPVPTPTPTPTPTLPPFLPVPYFGQQDFPWGDDEYNDASSWYQVDPSMARWGCATTSTAMVLKYHNINQIPGTSLTDPGSLNEWLKSQSDGYLRNGLVNWHAIKRLTRIAHDLYGSQILDFRRNDADITLLDADLAAGRPDILEVPGHFVVAKGKREETYAINDPISTETTTLQSYSNSFLTMRRLIPTSTNLSTLLLVVDNSVNLSVSGGNAAFGNTFVENPLIDDFNGNNTSGMALRIFELHLPEDGAYSISISAPTPTPFTLQIYDYDTSANPTISPFNEIANFESPIEIQLNYTQGMGGEMPRKVFSFEKTVEDIENAWLLGWIDNEGIKVSFVSKISNAKGAKEKDKTTTSQNLLLAALLELEAQKGKHINLDAYRILFEDINSLLNN